MDSEHKAMFPIVANMSLKEFETKYMQTMVTDHQKTANTMMAHEKMTKDPDLKAFIAKTLPVVQKHLANSQKHANMNM
jgi:putative membrane protein